MDTEARVLELLVNALSLHEAAFTAMDAAGNEDYSHAPIYWPVPEPQRTQAYTQPNDKTFHPGAFLVRVVRQKIYDKHGHTMGVRYEAVDAQWHGAPRTGLPGPEQEVIEAYAAHTQAHALETQMDDTVTVSGRRPRL